MPFRCALSPFITAPSRPCLQQLCQQVLTVAPRSRGARQRWRRDLHSTASLRDDQIDNSTNHYETLKLQPGATPGDIKKSFYSLSKTHHPDHNPSNPHAARRFMRISEAYSILSIPAKRAAYDRDTLRLHSHSHSHHGGRHGSYSSTGPAGGRPASGLSRRRGTFHGPPPSFFRSGGWGTQGAKRKAAHDDSTGGAANSSTAGGGGTGSQQNATGTGAGTAGGMGPGQDPFGHGTEVPHFDRESHERTGRHSDRRRAARHAVGGEHISIEPERGMTGMFFIIGGVLMLSILGPVAIGRMWRGSTGMDQERKGKNKKASASPA
ncbi:DnaJ-domain-containing protein [Hypoxylon sp. FL1150]|nr:DnaJ-domain-containing protein [Hypoxylon sp. FL1150]